MLKWLAQFSHKVLKNGHFANRSFSVEIQFSAYYCKKYLFCDSLAQSTRFTLGSKTEMWYFKAGCVDKKWKKEGHSRARVRHPRLWLFLVLSYRNRFFRKEQPILECPLIVNHFQTVFTDIPIFQYSLSKTNIHSKWVIFSKFEVIIQSKITIIQ